MPFGKKKIVAIISLFFLAAGFSSSSCAQQTLNSKSKMEESTEVKQSASAKTEDPYQEYLHFFEEVYDMMDENYYMPVTRETLDRFIAKFKRGIYPQLQSAGKTSNYIKWRTAAYLVDHLKTSEDTFSAFFPPQFAEEYEKDVLGKKIDLGIEGEIIEEGFIITRLEPRSDAYIQGLRIDDIILKIDDEDVRQLEVDMILSLLTPVGDTRVMVYYLDHVDKYEKSMELISKEYFRQSVFMVPVDVPGVYCLQIKSFNRKTSEDMFHYLSMIGQQEESGLILDIRGNPGGPPLAARAISSFFLTPGEDFAYFQKKGHPKALLKVPEIPAKYHYKGPIVILVNGGSGSASELFSGIMQKRNRAVLMGTNTAGKVLLKSMFYFDDESMVLLVTSRGHFPDGSVFSFDGLTPDYLHEEENVDLINAAAVYLEEKIKSGDSL